jgi:hypothetical protein
MLSTVLRDLSKVLRRRHFEEMFAMPTAPCVGRLLAVRHATSASCVGQTSTQIATVTEQEGKLTRLQAFQLFQRRQAAGNEGCQPNVVDLWAALLIPLPTPGFKS